MSKRLQVILEDEEMEQIKALARKQHVSVAEWVRHTLRSARLASPGTESKSKLEAIRSAVNYSFPTADIDLMLGEIESGYIGK